MTKHLLSGAILMALSLSYAPYAMAADVNVNTTNALADAVANAADGDVIHVAAGTYKLDSELDISGKAISIIGDGKVVFDGQKATRVINVHNKAGLTVQNVIIENGYVNDSGNNKGAGIRVDNSTLTATNCKFVGNTVEGMESNWTGGAGIHAASSTVNLSHSEFTGGSAYQGGAITLQNSDIDAKNCLFDNNKTVYADGGKKDGAKGGAICVRTDNGTVHTHNFEYCVFTNNVAWGNGGAVSYNVSGGAAGQNSTYRGCSFVRNSTNIDVANPARTDVNDGIRGGAFFIDTDGKLKISFYSCTIAQNYAGNGGGGIALATLKAKGDDQKAEFINCTIVDNHNLDNSGNGAGIWINENTKGGKISFINDIIVGNYSMKMADKDYAVNPSSHWEHSDLITTGATKQDLIELNNSVIGYMNNAESYTGEYPNLKIQRDANAWVAGEEPESLLGELDSYNENYYAYPFSISASTWSDDELGDMELAAERGCPTDQFGADWTVKCIGSVQTDEDGLEENAAPVFYQEASSTGIKGISSTTEKVSDDAYYTLDGRRVAAPAQKGIYIHNGKKVLK